MPQPLPPPRTGRWIERWSVESDDMDREYVVSRDAQGEFGCSCPQWKFQKAPKTPCKHIHLLQAWLRIQSRPAATPPRQRTPRKAPQRATPRQPGSAPLEAPGRSLLRKPRKEEE